MHLCLTMYRCITIRFVYSQKWKTTDQQSDTARPAHKSQENFQVRFLHCWVWQVILILVVLKSSSFYGSYWGHGGDNKRRKKMASRAGKLKIQLQPPVKQSHKAPPPPPPSPPYLKPRKLSIKGISCPLSVTSFHSCCTSLSWCKHCKNTCWLGKVSYTFKSTYDMGLRQWHCIIQTALLSTYILDSSRGISFYLEWHDHRLHHPFYGAFLLAWHWYWHTYLPFSWAHMQQLTLWCGKESQKKMLSNHDRFIQKSQPTSEFIFHYTCGVLSSQIRVTANLQSGSPLNSFRKIEVLRSLGITVYPEIIDPMLTSWM